MLDCDTPEAADYVAENFQATPTWQITTSGGRHYLFSDPEGKVPIRVNLMNLGLDIRSKCSIIVASPSYSQERGRRWELKGSLVRPEELPILPTGWLADPERAKRVEPQCKPIQVGRQIESVRRYINKILAVSGSAGHNSVYRAACKLAEAGLSEAQMFAELWAWNITNALPPFSEKELRHKAFDSVNRRKS